LSTRHRKSFFLRGLVTLLPAVFTLFVLVTVVQFADRYVATPINSTIYASLERTGFGWRVLRELGVDPAAVAYLDPDALPPDLAALLESDGPTGKAFHAALAEHRATSKGFLRDLERLAVAPEKLHRDVTAHVHPAIGVLLSLALVLTVGYLASGYLGRRIVSGADRLLQSIPVVRSVYPYAKQLVDFFLSDEKLEFESVIALRYPSDNLWSIGLVTGGGLRALSERERRPMVSVFVPSSPVPMTGYTIFVEVSRVVPLPISVDDALRITVSGGVLVPPAEKVEDLLDGLRALGNHPMEQGAPPADGART